MKQTQNERLAAWQWVVSPEGAALREKTTGMTHPTPAQVVALRKRFDEFEVHAALQLVAARAKAATKFGDRSTGLLADPEGVEMASSRRVAAWKAARIARFLESVAQSVRGSGASVLDVCCGIGGDAMAFREAGLAVRVADIDPIRAWMAGVNVGCEAECVDAGEAVFIEQARTSGVRVVHIDPARRGERGRVWTLEDLRPAPVALRAWIDAVPEACLKLGPGIDYEALRAGVLGEAASRGEVEIVSEGGKLTQALVWTGKLAGTLAGAVAGALGHHGLRRATLLTTGQAHTLAGDADVASRLPVSPQVGRFVYEVDDAIERAQLLTVACELAGMGMAHPALGLLTGDDGPEALASRWDASQAWLSGFEILDVMGWNERKVEQRLRQLGAGLVEVKTRDKVVNPDELQPKWSKREGAPMVVFVLRFGSSVRVLIARRVSRAAATGSSDSSISSTVDGIERRHTKTHNPSNGEGL